MRPLHHSSGLMTVASVLVHRFYMRQALQDFEEKASLKSDMKMPD